MSIQQLKNFLASLNWTVTTIVSVVMLVLSIVGTGYMLIRLPEDYFLEKKRNPRFKVNGKIVWRRLLIYLLTNLFGWVLIAIGLLLLVLPGQGLLTVLVGVIMVDFPRKYEFERWIIQRPKVLAGINRLREKFKKPKLKI